MIPPERTPVTPAAAVSGAAAGASAPETPSERKKAAPARENSARQKPTKIFLKVPSALSSDCGKAKKMCAIFEGDIPVILYYSDNKQYDFRSGIRIECNANLIHGLKKLLGEANVVLR